MLAYAAGRPRIGARPSSPNTMLFIICGHIVLIAVVMSARMAFTPRAADPPTTIIPIEIQKPPPPNRTPTREANGARTRDTHPQSQEPAPTTYAEPWTAGPTVDPGPVARGDPVPLPPLQLPPLVTGPTKGAVLLTPPSELRPPYPQSKLLAEQEAALTLRLTIDEQGRVLAVEPVGRADPVFLAAARRHLIAHWRYKPALKDGRAVPSSITVTLRFELDG